MAEARLTKSAVSLARAAAFDMLVRVERESSYASELLHSAALERLSTADHALATELVMGVLRWRSRIDDEIARASSQPLGKLDLEILVALRLAVYQFRCLDRIPLRAALHESVELVKRARKRSAAGFVNAVLRKLSSSAPWAPLPEQQSSAKTLAQGWAHPEWLVERWVRDYGLAAAGAICKQNQAVPQTAIRLRGLEASGAKAPTEKEGSIAALEALRHPKSDHSKSDQEQITLRPGGLLALARCVEAGDVTKTEAFRTGEIVIQDEASQLVAALAASSLKDGAKILDCCAAPGGKTLALLDRNPGATITAVEIHPHRARLMQRLLRERLAGGRIRDLEIVVADARRLPLLGGFDCVLVDVPCSGTGTLGRNPEIKWRLTASDLAELQARQIEILRGALAQVAPGGRVIYSTCSLEREENEDVVEKILSDNKSLRVVDCRGELERLKAQGELMWTDLGSLVRGADLRTIPGVHPCDGFFAAIFKKG
jgi:16S rRNA (cytosine967-C5)-methyltransferase